jgi:hypothetical protein
MVAKRHASQVGHVQHLCHCAKTVSLAPPELWTRDHRNRPWRIAATVLSIAIGFITALHAEDDVPATNALSAFEVNGQGFRFGMARVDPAARTVTFPARVNMTNGLIEYAVVTDYGKSHESLFITAVRPIDVQSALLVLNAKAAGTNAVLQSSGPLPRPSRVAIHVAWTHNGRPVRTALHELLRLIADPDGETTMPFPAGPWLFNGSYISAEGFAAHYEGSILSLIRDPTAIVNNPHPDRDDDEVHVPATDHLPPLASEVAIVLEVIEPAADPDPP